MDAAVAAEATRRGISKAAVIRACVARELGAAAPPPEDPWDAMIGWLDDVWGAESRIRVLTRESVHPPMLSLLVLVVRVLARRLSH